MSKNKYYEDGTAMVPYNKSSKITPTNKLTKIQRDLQYEIDNLFDDDYGLTVFTEFTNTKAITPRIMPSEADEVAMDFQNSFREFKAEQANTGSPYGREINDIRGRRNNTNDVIWFFLIMAGFIALLPEIFAVALIVFVRLQAGG